MSSNQHDESLAEVFFRMARRAGGSTSRWQSRLDLTFYEEHPEKTLRRLREANEIEEEFNRLVGDLDMPDGDDTPER